MAWTHRLDTSTPWTQMTFQSASTLKYTLRQYDISVCVPVHHCSGGSDLALVLFYHDATRKPLGIQGRGPIAVLQLMNHS